MSWELNSIAYLGDIRLRAEGQPQVTEPPLGQAVAFDGERDGLFSQTNSLAGMTAFTIEIVFWPDRGELKEQRFFHVGQAYGDRALFETRLTADDQWYLDTFIRSKDSDCALLNKEFFHPLGAWYHLAMSCDGQQQIAVPLISHLWKIRRRSSEPRLLASRRYIRGAFDYRCHRPRRVLSPIGMN